MEEGNANANAPNFNTSECVNLIFDAENHILAVENENCVLNYLKK